MVHDIFQFLGIGKSAPSCDLRQMTLKPLGDAAWLVEFSEISGEAALARVSGLASALRADQHPGVVDMVPSFTSLAVHFRRGNGREIRNWISATPFTDQLHVGEEIEIHVCYGGELGPDLLSIAAALGMSADEVIACHSEAIYTVAAVGFSPGFPYLLGLPSRLHLPRRATPRTCVPTGSVAIGGGQAGIYPCDSPGGWHLIGRTQVPLFDVNAPSPAHLQPGDRVRFVPTDRSISVRPSLSNITQVGVVEVISAGGQTTVQDRGRPGHESSGVSPGGAADQHSMRVANRLVGNPEDAAVLECCVSGPILKFHIATVVALVSGGGRSRAVRAGEIVDFTHLGGGVRACIAIAGGVKVPRMLNSSSTDVRGGFGGHHGRALQVGDLLELGNALSHPAVGNWTIGRADQHSSIELRYLTGVQADWFPEEARERFRSEIYQISAKSDRMGARLTGARLDLTFPREMISQPVACGSVQVPPDGQPIVLLAERQTIGGYPQIGHVISVDLPKLARAWPGTWVKLRQVSWDEAQAAREEEEQYFSKLQMGLELLEWKSCDG